MKKYISPSFESYKILLDSSILASSNAKNTCNTVATSTPTDSVKHVSQYDTNGYVSTTMTLEIQNNEINDSFFENYDDLYLGTQFVVASTDDGTLFGKEEGEENIAFVFNNEVVKNWIDENRKILAVVTDTNESSPSSSLTIEFTEEHTDVNNDNFVTGYMACTSHNMSLIEPLCELSDKDNVSFAFQKSGNQIKAIPVENKDLPSFIFRCNAIYKMLDETDSVIGIFFKFTGNIPMELTFVVSKLPEKTLSIVEKEVDENEFTKCYKPHYDIRYKYDEVHHESRTFNHGNLSTNVTGIKYRDNYQELIDALCVGLKLTLEKDNENPYDENAIKVSNDGELLGYIPKKHIPAIALFMANGILEAEITNIDDLNIDLEICPSKTDVDKKAVEKFDIRIYQINKVKTENTYAESSSKISLEDFISALE